MSANFLLLRAARNADYNKVTAELRSAIPPGQTAYGSITFWLALNDHSYISSEATDPRTAADQFHARYFVTSDTLWSPAAPGVAVLQRAYYENLSHQLEEVTAQGRLVGHIRDPYYGDLKIYELAVPR
jgi:hypothetical protein